MSVTATPAPVERVEAAHAAARQAAPSPSPRPGLVVCTGLPGGKLHLRDCGGTDCAVRGVLEEGTPVQTVERQGSWLRITAPQPGWVNRKYLCSDQETP